MLYSCYYVPTKGNDIFLFVKNIFLKFDFWFLLLFSIHVISLKFVVNAFYRGFFKHFFTNSPAQQ